MRHEDTRGQWWTLQLGWSWEEAEVKQPVPPRTLQTQEGTVSNTIQHDDQCPWSVSNTLNCAGSRFPWQRFPLTGRGSQCPKGWTLASSSWSFCPHPQQRNEHLSGHRGTNAHNSACPRPLLVTQQRCPAEAVQRTRMPAPIRTCLSSPHRHFGHVVLGPPSYR